MDTIETVKLEDNLDYYIVDEIKASETTYYYLVDEETGKSFRVRKLIKNEQGEFLNGLDNDDEFDKAMLLFSKKHKDD